MNHPQQAMSLELQTAVKAAKAAGAITVSRLGELSHREIVAKEYKDFVTEVDKQCEAVISATIMDTFPDDGLLCEEGTIGSGASGRTWIVDPLDGTLNFIHSFPVFGISIALRNASGELQAGVVYQPVLDELFTAEKGKGAFLNAKPISISGRVEKESYLFATGLPFKEYDHYMEHYIGLLRDVIKDSAGIRRAGAASIDLAYTAAGRFDGFFEYKLFPWDFSAGVLLIREAGGIVTGFDGSEDVYAHTSILAGSPSTHSLLLEKAQRHFGTSLTTKTPI